MKKLGKMMIFASIFMLIFSANVWAEKNNITSANDDENLQKIKENFDNCSKDFQVEQRKCPDSWSFKCYDFLVNTNKKTQKCYAQIAIVLFTKYYDLSKANATIKINDFIKQSYEQYIFIYRDNNYCKKNNCGVSIYLYSEYATTQNVQEYLTRAINTLESH